MEGHQNCWCLPCREANLQQYSTMRMGRLLSMFRWHLREETSQALDATFASVMRRILAAKAFKLVAERETGYRQVKRQLDNKQSSLEGNCKEGSRSLHGRSIIVVGYTRISTRSHRMCTAALFWTFVGFP